MCIRDRPQGSRIQIRQSKDELLLARLSGVPFTQRLVTKFDLPVVGWRENRRKVDARPKIYEANLHNETDRNYEDGVGVKNADCNADGNTDCNADYPIVPNNLNL